MSVDHADNAIIVNGVRVKVNLRCPGNASPVSFLLIHLSWGALQLLYSNDPSEMDYTAHGISDAVVIDNTGIWRDRAGLEKHLKSKGVSKVS